MRRDAGNRPPAVVLAPRPKPAALREWGHRRSVGRGMVTKQRLPIAVYLEVGQKRTIAGALDWPGWCRGGRDEASALGALVEYAPRYAEIVSNTKLSFAPPGDPGTLAVAERLKGTSTTDFGVPAVAPEQDAEPFDEAERKRS